MFPFDDVIMNSQTEEGLRQRAPAYFPTVPAPLRVHMTWGAVPVAWRYAADAGGTYVNRTDQHVVTSAVTAGEIFQLKHDVTLS